jgi:hypothetical protein
MFGDGVAYMPYLYYAVKRAGEVGLFKARIPYKIQDVRSYDRSILRSDGNIETDIQERRWSLDTDDEPGEKKQRTVRLLTPLRMKKAGNYVSEPGMDDILRASARRVAILEEMYGDGLGEILQDACDGTSFSTIRSNTRWQDLPYYSSRQNRPLMLGGVIGDITVSHPFSAREDSLLQAASVFHIGKNTVFGLGQVEIHEDREENIGEYRQGATS